MNMKFLDKISEKSNDSKSLKCKKVMGMTVCKMKAGDVLTLPLGEGENIPLNVYVSDSFKKESKKVIDTLKHINKQVNNIFDINTKYIEKEQNIPKEVIHFPTVIIGRGNESKAMYGNDFDSVHLIKKAQDYLNSKYISF